MLRERVEQPEAFVRLLRKLFFRGIMLLRWVPVEREGNGALPLPKKETIRRLFKLVEGFLSLPLAVVKGVVVGVHMREVTEVAAVEVVDTQRRCLLSLVSGALVMRGHMILLRDTMAATVGELVLIMVQVAEVAVQRR